jgi:hypothetical protein
VLISFRVTIADSMVLHNQSIKFYIDWTEERNEQLRRRLLADGSLEEAAPQHCSQQAQTCICSGIGSVATKHRRKNGGNCGTDSASSSRYGPDDR